MKQSIMTGSSSIRRTILYWRNNRSHRKVKILHYDQCPAIVKDLKGQELVRQVCWFHARHYFVDAYLVDSPFYRWYGCGGNEDIPSRRLIV